MTKERYHDMTTPPPDTRIEDPPRDSPQPTIEDPPRDSPQPTIEDPPRDSSQPTESVPLSAQQPEPAAEPREGEIEDPPREAGFLGAPPATGRPALPPEENDPLLQGRLSGLTRPSETDQT
jgi:hypothetical protein